MQLTESIENETDNGFYSVDFTGLKMKTRDLDLKTKMKPLKFKVVGAGVRKSNIILVVGLLAFRRDFRFFL